VKIYYSLFLLILEILSASDGYSQQLVRSTVSSFGSVVRNGELYLSQTAGQGSLHTSSYSDELVLRQGFQQPTKNLNSQSNSCLVSVFPNPNNGSFHFLTNTTENDPITIALVDVNGKSFMNLNAEESRTKFIDFSSRMPVGIYILQLHNSKGMCATEKLIVTP
jgi:hypothetical protein